MWYHVSRDNLGEGKITLYPQLPRSMDYSEGNIPRICVAPTIHQCLMAITGQEDIAQETILKEFGRNNPRVYFTEAVPYRPPIMSDFRRTDERWLLEEAEFWFLGYVDIQKFFLYQTIQPSKQPTRENFDERCCDVVPHGLVHEHFLEKIIREMNVCQCHAH